jgi:hypothetical protein
MVRPTFSRPVCLGIKYPSGAFDQIFITVRRLRVCSEGLGFFITTLHGPNSKYRFQQYPYCLGVFTDQLLRNGLHNPLVLLLRALPRNGRCVFAEAPLSNGCIRHNTMGPAACYKSTVSSGGYRLHTAIYWRPAKRCLDWQEYNRVKSWWQW